MTHADLIKALGGGTKVANWLSETTGMKVDREAVYKWRVNKVPPKWRASVAKMAKDRRAKLPEGFLSWEGLQ